MVLTDPELPCTEPMGMQNDYITDEQIESISVYSSWSAQNSRLNSKINSWRPIDYHSANQWISVNLYRQTQVTGVVVQGDFGNNWWVETYKVSYNLDNDFSNYFEFVKDESGNPEVCIEIYFS